MSTSLFAPTELYRIASLRACFFGRIPSLDVSLERKEAMSLLATYHRELLIRNGLREFPFVTAEQVHGNNIAIVDEVSSDLLINGVDGLIIQKRGVTLGIYVADCAPVWIVARDGSAGALLHSGKKGTQLGITTNGIEMLCNVSNLTPEDFILEIGPCIRPLCYEVDFAAKIRAQATAMGIKEIYDQQICTACHPDLYYSYRREKGLTGRMLATLTLA